MNGKQTAYIIQWDPTQQSKEWTSDTHNGMNEPQNNYVEWKKTKEREYLLHDCIYIKFKKIKQILTENKSVVS